MESKKLQQTYELRSVRISRLAAEMGKLFTPGHNAVQSAQYEATRDEYLQAQVDRMYPDEPEGTHSHYTTG